MILKEFSNYIKNFDENISACFLLLKWLKIKIEEKEETLTGTIIKKEIKITNNKNFPFEGKSKTGENLIESLYFFAQSYEQQKFNRWIHYIKASDFNNINKKK